MLQSIWLVTKDATLSWQRNDASQLAASLAFYAALSLAPLLVVTVAVSGLFFGEAAVQGQLVSGMGKWIGTSGAELLQTVVASVDNSQTGMLATIFGVFAMLFGSTRFFLGLQAALNRVWRVRTEPGRSLWGGVKNRLLSFAMVVGIGFAVFLLQMASTIMTAIVVHISHVITVPAYLRVINLAGSFMIATVLFAVIYKVLPDAKVFWKDVLVGSTVTALLFTIGRYVIAIYLGLTAAGSTYGAAASLFVLLLWVYYSAQVFLLGAEFTAAYARHHGSLSAPVRDSA